MGVPEQEANGVRSLTRKFGSFAELREELDRNLRSGSCWIPLAISDDRPNTRDEIEIHLVLADGRVVDAIKGRVACVGPDGVAVDPGPLGPELIAMLSEEHVPEPPAFQAIAAPVTPPAPLAAEPSL